MNGVQKKIFTELSEKILSGSCLPGNLIPGERELARSYKCTVMNAKAAVNLLCKRGLVTRKRHKGTLVCPVENSSFLRQILSAEDKLIFLLYSDNATKIHWDETSIRSFCETAKKYKYHTILQKIPEGRKSLETLLHILASFHPEGLAVFDDNFDHRLLYEVRHFFTHFSCPVIRLNRFGPSVPLLHFAGTNSADIDHFRNGYLAGTIALSAESGLYATVSTDITTFTDDDSIHSNNKIDGIHTAFRDAEHDIPLNYTWQDSALKILADLIQENNGEVVLIAINQEIAAKVYDFLVLKNLKAPENFRIITIEDQKQYEKYSFSTIAVPKQKTGELMAFLACKKLFPANLNTTFSIRLTGEFIRRKTF